MGKLSIPKPVAKAKSSALGQLVKPKKNTVIKML